MRDPFLDALRTASIIRVVIFHVVASSVLTFFITTIPIIFFVSGDLLYRSMRRAKPSTVVYHRLRRLLVPLVVFSSVVLGTYYAAQALTGHRFGDITPGQAVFWFLPLRDPVAGGPIMHIIAIPLWFMRVMLWLMVLGPALFWMARRNAGLTVTALLAVVLIGEVANDAHGVDPTLHGRISQVAGVALYGIFLVLGAQHARRRFVRVTPGQLVATAAVLGPIGMAWVFITDVPHHELDSSYLGLLLAGVAWLALALRLRRPITTFARRRRPAAVIAWVSRRAFTIYLWHMVGIALVGWAIGKIAPTTSELAYRSMLGAGTLVFVMSAVVAFGWIEDLAAHRRLTLWPASTPVRAAGAAPVPASVGASS